MNARLDSFTYDDEIVRKFLFATFIWGLVGMLVGLVIALELAYPALNLGLPYTSFGRLRPLHTNAVIFAFAGNAFFCGAYYSTQRLLKARMFSDALSKLHFWGWQLIILSAAITLPLGFTQAKEYAELEWPIDILIAVVWVIFAVNFFGTIVKRRERHLYVAIWFYIASIITVAITRAPARSTLTGVVARIDTMRMDHGMAGGGHQDGAGSEHHQMEHGMMTQGGGLALTVVSGPDTVSVHLGPAWYLKQQNPEGFAPGDRVKVDGVLMTAADHPHWMAYGVTKGDLEIALRDDRGHPRWMDAMRMRMQQMRGD